MGQGSNSDTVIMILVFISLASIGAVVYLVFVGGAATDTEMADLQAQIAELEKQKLLAEQKTQQVGAREEELRQKLEEASEAVKSAKKESRIQELASKAVKERDSPFDHVKQSDIRVLRDRVEINLDNVQWSTFADTNSMDPVIDIGANGLYIIPESPDQLHIGDIVSYQSEYVDRTIVHRIITIEEDAEGWYSVFKGDNLPEPDPGKIRWNQVKRLLIGVIY